MKVSHLAIAALLSFSGGLFADHHGCKCDKECSQSCSDKKGEKCDCSACDCGKMGQCESGKCEPESKTAPKAKTKK